ncbi:MAG: cell division protein FtsZ, partial [Dehalococcoidia bacterium]
GVGRSAVPTFNRLPFERRRSFRKKGRETQRGLEAVDQAISELSVTITPRDAGKALYMISAPSKEMNIAMMRELGGLMREMAEDAVIRSGDYPRAGNDVSVTLIFSKLSNVPRLKEFYRNASSSATTIQKRQMEADEKLRELEEAAEGLPSLISSDGH